MRAVRSLWRTHKNQPVTRQPPCTSQAPDVTAPACFGDAAAPVAWWELAAPQTLVCQADFPRHIASSPASGNNWHLPMGLRCEPPLVKPDFSPLPRSDSWGPKSWSNWLKVTPFLPGRKVKMYLQGICWSFPCSVAGLPSTLKEEEVQIQPPLLPPFLPPP